MIPLGLALALAGCALPRSGPSAGDFRRAGADRSIDLVEATRQDALASREGRWSGFGPSWQTVPVAPVGTIGVGDVLSVALFERDGLNIFAAGPDGATRFESIPVDPSGGIQLPYVGQVHLAGLTPAQARAAILQKLRRIALSSDVTVAVTERHSQLVSIQGDVTRPGMVPLGPESARLTELLSVAGPTPTDLELATVTVRRGTDSVSARLSDIYESREQDIALRPGDVVVVRSVPALVNVLGAAGLQGRVRITHRNYSVVDVVGDARGLDDAAASPAAVYLMRLGEPSEANASVPKVYHFDFRDPAQIAVASAFVVHNGDAVLISNAPFAQAHKVFSAFTGVLNTSRSVAQ